MSNEQHEELLLANCQLSSLIGITLGKLAIIMSDISNDELSDQEIYWKIRELFLHTSQKVDAILSDNSPQQEK